MGQVFAIGDVVASEYEGEPFESVVHDMRGLGYLGEPYLLVDIPGYESPQWWYASRCTRVVPAGGDRA